MSKAAIVDRHEEDDLALRIDIPRLGHQQAPGLSHGFNDQDARHDRALRKMTLEEGFIDRDILYAGQSSAGLIGLGSVDHQKGRSVGKSAGIIS